MLISPKPDQEGNKLMFLSEWREFPSAPCLAGGKKLDDRSLLDVVEIARPWHASEFVSFLVGLRTYQHPGICIRADEVAVCNEKNISRLPFSQSVCRYVTMTSLRSTVGGTHLDLHFPAVTGGLFWPMNDAIQVFWRAVSRRWEGNRTPQTPWWRVSWQCSDEVEQVELWSLCVLRHAGSFST